MLYYLVYASPWRMQIGHGAVITRCEILVIARAMLRVTPIAISRTSPMLRCMNPKLFFFMSMDQTHLEAAVFVLNELSSEGWPAHAGPCVQRPKLCGLRFPAGYCSLLTSMQTRSPE